MSPILFVARDTEPYYIHVEVCIYYEHQVQQEFQSVAIKDVRAHCYCASLVCTLFIGHARAMSFFSARTESKT